MKYLTYSGNNIISARLPEGSTVFYAPEPREGIPKRSVRRAVTQAFREPLGMPTLPKLLNAKSRVLIAFDDNCQPFPHTASPDIRQQSLEALLPLLYECGVQQENIQLICAVALHRKMKQPELERMLGKRMMREFYPQQLKNFDAEDRDDIVDLGSTENDEPVQVCRAVVECDLVIYLDTVQIPLNGGHKSVAVGLGTYESIAAHHAPEMTAHVPHVMQPEGSQMHASIERISRVISEHAQIMVMEAALNNATYPFHVRYLGKPDRRCNVIERVLKGVTPLAISLLPESMRRKVLKSVRGAYDPIEINVGAIDAVHQRTLATMTDQMSVDAPKQYDTLVFGLADLSPYAVDARINPVLVVSDVLGYVFNWFYKQPLVKRGGVIILLNPAFEVFHEEYHVAYRRFYDEVLPATRDPFEMKTMFQEKFARDPHLIDCYRNRFAHHGFHPFTVWYWATYALSYLAETILVGPTDDTVAKRLGVSWAPSLDHALGRAREVSGGDDVAALTVPPFFYVR